MASGTILSDNYSFQAKRAKRCLSPLQPLRRSSRLTQKINSTQKGENGTFCICGRNDSHMSQGTSAMQKAKLLLPNTNRHKHVLNNTDTTPTVETFFGVEPIDLTINKTDEVSEKNLIKIESLINSQKFGRNDDTKLKLTEEPTRPNVKNLPDIFQPCDMMGNCESQPIIFGDTEFLISTQQKEEKMSNISEKENLYEIDVGVSKKVAKKSQNSHTTRANPRLKPRKNKRGKPKRKAALAKAKNRKNKQKYNAINMNLMENSTEAIWRYENTQSTQLNTMLPHMYPPHFKYQLPPEAMVGIPLIPPQADIMPSEVTNSFEWGESSSSPSLPESLRGLLENNDLKHIFEIENVTYRLQDSHVYVLAAILSLRSEYLHKLLQKILAIDPMVLRKTIKSLKTPFKPDRDLFLKASPGANETPVGSVLNSPSPQIRTFFSAKSKYNKIA